MHLLMSYWEDYNEKYKDVTIKILVNHISDNST